MASMELFETYIPMDRRQAMARNIALPDRDTGAALFADISGFTPLTEGLAQTLGPRRGAEELSVHLNTVHQALIQEVDRYGGSVIGFAGDAITCWFQGDAGRRATTCALAMQRTMAQFSKVKLANARTVSLAVKVGIASGPVRRFLVGKPEIQLLDVLAGQTLNRMAAAAHQASRGEVILDSRVAEALDDKIELIGWRISADSQEGFAIVGACTATAHSAAWPRLAPLEEAAARPWLIQPVYERLRSGHGEFLTELRPAIALFVKFEGLAYDEDEQAGAKLSGYVGWLQETLARYEGFLVDVAIGDKGSYSLRLFWRTDRS